MLQNNRRKRPGPKPADPSGAQRKKSFKCAPALLRGIKQIRSADKLSFNEIIGIGLAMYLLQSGRPAMAEDCFPGVRVGVDA